jgi:hypothetical protein
VTTDYSGQVSNASEEPAAAVVTEANYPPYPYVWHRPPAKVVIKPDLLPAIMVLSLVPLAGMGVGWLWSRLAPAQRFLVLEDRQVPLPLESYHRFDDLAVFTVLCLGAGVVTGVAVWFLRQRRGPVLMIAAVLGSVIGGWLAMKVGVGWAEGQYPIPGAPKVGDLVDKAPMLESGWGILAWPLMTALTYGALSAWSGQDDLGRRLS